MNNRSIEPNHSGVYPQGIKYPIGDLLREIAVEKTIVAFDPLKKQWLTSVQADDTPSIAIPNLDGQLVVDPISLAAVADDFGHIVRQTPLAVLQPGSPRDIAKIIHYANRIGVTVAMRGQGHSPYGQSQADAGIVIDSRFLNTIYHISSTEVVVDAGVTLFELLTAKSRSRLNYTSTYRLSRSICRRTIAGGRDWRTHSTFWLFCRYYIRVRSDRWEWSAACLFFYPKHWSI